MKLASISYQINIELGKRFTYHEKVDSIREFTNNLSLRISLALAFLHWIENLVTCFMLRFYHPLKNEGIQELYIFTGTHNLNHTILDIFSYKLAY